MSQAKITLIGSMAFGAGCAEKTSSTLGCANMAQKAQDFKHICQTDQMRLASRIMEKQRQEAMAQAEECMGM